MEKVLLAVKVLKSDDSRVAKRLLQVNLQNNVSGFSRQVVEICENVFGCSLEAMVVMDGDLRSILKEKLICKQGERLRTQMLSQSKTDGLLMNSFNFNGKMKKYLELEATKNFSGVFLSRAECIECQRNTSSS